MQKSTAPEPARRRWPRCLPIILGLFAMSGVAASPTLPPEEYAVFRALLDHGLGPETQQVVVAESTTGDPAGILAAGPADEARAKDLGTTRELLADWALMNQRKFQLGQGFSTRVPHVLLADTERENLFRGDQPTAGWTRYFRKYPQSTGLVRLSRAGFSPARDAALVYLEFQCGAECGSGRLVQLTRGPSGSWQITSGELLWIAAPEERVRPAGPTP